MENWVRVFTSKGYEVIAEKGTTEDMPSIIIRMRKGTGELRSQMAFPMPHSGPEGLSQARADRDSMFLDLSQETIDAAVDHMLVLEPDLMDGSRHAMIIEN